MTTIIIPARYASTRFPGKPLAILNGPDGPKSLIQRSWEAAKACDVDAIYIATDDNRIKTAAQAFGADVIMTPRTCKNGTERCAAALDHIPNTDIIINLQGDAPLTPPWFISSLIDEMKTHDAQVATPVLRVDNQAHALLLEDRKNGRVGGTTAVFDKHGKALYFSKEVIPYIPETFSDTLLPVFHHVGCYAYTPEALRLYASFKEGTLEKLEGLEQLRFLENDIPVHCAQVEAKGKVFWELNNPIDIERLEKVFNS